MTLFDQLRGEVRRFISCDGAGNAEDDVHENISRRKRRWDGIYYGSEGLSRVAEVPTVDLRLSGRLRAYWLSYVRVALSAILATFTHMNQVSLVRAALVILMASGASASAALENRLDSLGPLKRYDPYAPSPEFLVKIHGDPRRGLPETAGDQIQRVSDKTWYLEMGRRIARMEPNFITGQVVVQDVIEADAEWSISPDGKLIFASRQGERAPTTGECFDLATGESKWTFEKGMDIMDVCFTPDGSQVVILHELPRPPLLRPSAENMDPENIRKLVENHQQLTKAAVSWYDAKTGEMTRRVDVSGNGSSSSGDIITDYLAFSGDRLYVARPCNNSNGECQVIKPGATESEKIDAGAVSDDEAPCVRVGGAHGEFVVFYGGSNVVLFRQDDDGALTKLKALELERMSDGRSYEWSARFTPDGDNLVLSSCSQTIYFSTRDSAEAQRKEFPGGSPVADFSEDGNYFVTFDDGGGRVRKAASWETMESFETKIRPPHCCPITEAGFSLTGNYIISSDEVRLLLWSKDGEELAELYSARSDAKEAVRMQSPVIVEEEGKIYAADGYDFLEWDLKALNRRLGRKPDNVPRVKGEVVFRDRKQENDGPELMNIRIDPKGEHIITATRSVVRYRPLASSDPIRAHVPKDDIYMNPRTFMDGTSPSSTIVRAGSDAYNLDLTGKEDPTLLGWSVIGANIAANQLFSIGNDVIRVHPIGKAKEVVSQSVNLASLPKEWSLRPENAIVSADGKWVVAIPTIWGKGSVLAVIDVAKRQIVRSLPVKWTATSLSISDNGKRLLVGSSNRAVYEFDLLKMTGTP
jgi:WD40 repeat protein